MASKLAAQEAQEVVAVEVLHQDQGDQELQAKEALAAQILLEATTQPAAAVALVALAEMEPQDHQR